MKRAAIIVFIALFTLSVLCSCSQTEQNIPDKTENPTQAETAEPAPTDQVTESATDVPAATDEPVIDDGVTPDSCFQFVLLENDTYEVRARHSILLRENVVIPSSYNGKPVTVVGKRAFEGYNNIKDIVIPDSIETIDDYAFRGCRSLNKIVVPQSVKVIGDTVFPECTIILPDGLQECGKPFENYFSSNLVLNKYDNALYIGSENNPYLYLIKADNDLIREVKINENTRFIGEGAFSNCKGITEITIPAGVKSIGTSAFGSCTFLQNIDLPDSLTYIAPDAFAGCDNLTYSQYDNGFYLGNKDNPYLMLITVNIDVESVTVNENTRFIACKAFSHSHNSWSDENCRAKSITLPEGIKEIGNNLFACCSIESITIPNGVTSIGSNAFSHCPLKEIVIPDSVTYIGEGAFSNCIRLEKIRIPDSTSYIGFGAFSHCENLKEIYIPDTIKFMNSSFDGCDSLPFAEYENGLYLGSGDNPYFIFVRVKDLNNPRISINENTKFIAANAFEKYEALTDLVLPAGMNNIGDYAFNEFRGLLSITIPDGITSIGIRAFKSCPLKEIRIPDSVTKIGELAFFMCSNLKTVVIPDGIADFGSYAFGADVTFNAFDNISFTDSFPLYSLRELEFAIGDPSDKIITYNGTMEEWSALEETDYSMRRSSENYQFNYIVHCTDGDYDSMFY